ncbi:hypothetical protein ACHAWT_001556, partial [Skeletonema menzelii]
MSYSVTVNTTASGINQFFTFDDTANMTIDVCHEPPEQKMLQELHANNVNVQPPPEVCHHVYITPPFYASNTTVVQPPWNVDGNLIGVAMLCFVLPIVSSICLWVYTKMLLSRQNSHILKNDDGEIILPKTGFLSFHNPVWLLSFTFTFWYCLVMCGVIVFALTYPYLFLTLDEHLPIVDWRAIITYIRIVGIIVIILDTLLMLLMWIPTYSYKLRLWEMYYHLIGDNVEAEKYERRKTFFLAFRFIQFGFTFGFGLLLVSMMLSIVIVLIAITAVGFSYMFSTACLDVANPMNGVCISWEFLGGGQHCGAELVAFCNEWRMLQSSLIFWSAIVVAVGHYYLKGIGGMSYYQQVSVNSVLEAMKDELLNDTLIQKESSEMDNEESQLESIGKYDKEDE